MRFISLFAGIGGFDLALTRLGHTCVYANEWDKYASSIYNHHFPLPADTRDVRSVDSAEIPDADLLVGGFPCQAFSVAGKRRGFDDTRGTLFFEIARILREKHPRLCLLENVKGLLSHDNGNTFKTIIATLDELGYDLQWQVLNSKNFGVPQNRERVFIVGHLRGTPRPQVFPIGNTNPTPIEQLNQPKHSNDRVYSDNGLSPTLNTMQGGRRQPKIVNTLKQQGLDARLFHASTQETNSRKILRTLQKEIGTEAFTKWGLGILDTLQPQEVLQPILHGSGIRLPTSKEKSEMDDSPLARQKVVSERILRSLWETECNRRTPQKPRLARQFIEQLAETLQELPQQAAPLSIRRLTPLEAERLQGFPDGWTESISDTQRYKCLGNAVTVNVIQAIAQRL